MKPDPLSRLAVIDPYAVHAYVVTVTAVNAAAGTVTVDPNDDGGTLDQISFLGPAPAVGEALLAFHFGGTMVVLSTAGGGVVPDPVPPVITNAFTAVSGWSITEQESKRIQVNQLAVYCVWQRTGGVITVGPSGDIANVQLGNLSTAYKPALSRYGIPSASTGRVAGINIANDGRLDLCSVGGTSDIANGDSFSIGGLIPLINF
jgi:hypothetical protein